MRELDAGDLYRELATAIIQSDQPTPCEEAPELFYSEAIGYQNALDTMRAKQLCRFCLVSKQCAAYALKAEEPFGVWGGLDVYDRRALLRSSGQPHQDQ